MAVVETPHFLRRAEALMSDEERSELMTFVGDNPEAGVVMAHTGGVRKLRWSLPDRGKRGGARVIYYYHNDDVPLFLLSAYAKNEKANLTRAEQNALRGAVQLLVGGYPPSGERRQ